MVLSPFSIENDVSDICCVRVVIPSLTTEVFFTLIDIVKQSL